jgi:hypothetical protein
MMGIVVVALVSGVSPQEGEYHAVENPFQDDYQFVVNSDLQPMVEVAGVRWTRFGMHVKGDREIDRDKEMPVLVELGFVNTNPEEVKILVIALLEDAYGNTLDRVECSKVNANNDRLKESTQKFKISGLVLETMRRVYLFCEIE